MSFSKLSQQLQNLKKDLQSFKQVARNPNVRALHKIPGVRRRVLKGKYKDLTGPLHNEVLSIEKDDKLTPSEKAIEIAKTTAYHKLLEGINEYLQPDKQLTLERVIRDSEANTSKNNKEGSTLNLSYTAGKRISYARYPFTKEYRDPNQWDKSTREATDVIHIGSHQLFKRYAVTSVNVLGKSTPAGRKGTPLEGLGYEPIGVVPKHTANPNQYRIFIRVGYPGRLVSHYGPGGPFTSQTDKFVTLKGRARHPVYTTFLGDSSLSVTFFDSVSASATSVGDAVRDFIAGAYLDIFGSSKKPTP